MEDSDKPAAKFLRLQNGDDVVAEVVETEDENGILYTLFHPLKVVYAQAESVGYLSVAFMPWVFPRICDQQEFVLHAEDVMLVANVTEKMNTYYWENLDYFLTNATDKGIEETQATSYEEVEEEASLLDVLKEMASKRTYH